MKITIEITSAELAQLVDHFHLKEVPAILDELHEDFEDPQDPDIEPNNEPENDPEPEPEPVPDPGWTAKTSQRNVRKSRAVEVKVDGEWHRFSSMTNAAKLIGCFPSQVSSALANGWMVRGYELRYAKEEQDEEDLPRGNGHE